MTVHGDLPGMVFVSKPPDTKIVHELSTLGLHVCTDGCLPWTCRSFALKDHVSREEAALLSHAFREAYVNANPALHQNDFAVRARDVASGLSEAG